MKMRLALENFLDKMDTSVNNRRELTILFGSQTGTAEEVAERIGREGKRRHFFCKVCAMDDFELVLSTSLRYSRINR